MAETTSAKAKDLVRQYVSASLELCSRVQAGLPHGTALDPLQVLVTGNLFRFTEQQAELNGVGYFKHGIGAMLWDARRPREIVGVVDIDLGREADGSTFYEFYPSWVNRFAESIGNEQLPEEAIEQACRALFDEGVLRSCTDPFDPPPRSVIPGRCCIPRLVYQNMKDEQQPWVANLGFELFWGPIGAVAEDCGERLLEARKYLELSLLPYPKPASRRQSFNWSEVKVLQDKELWPHDN